MEPPAPNSIPSAADINVFNTLDEKHAVKNFLGKNLAQAEAMFRENFLHYQEDLFWMGPKAFCFYVLAAMNYLRSEQSSGDADAANTFRGCVEFQAEQHSGGIAPALPAIRECLRAMLDEIDRYDCDPDIYGDMAKKYQKLLAKLEG